MFITDTESVRGVYDMYTLNSKAGILKRSGMDVDVIGSDQLFPIFSVSIKIIVYRWQH